MVHASSFGGAPCWVVVGGGVWGGLGGEEVEGVVGAKQILLCLGQPSLNLLNLQSKLFWDIMMRLIP